MKHLDLRDSHRRVTGVPDNGGLNSPEKTPHDLSSHRETAAVIGTFPKEFNKDHLHSLDWRFLIILFVSFLFHTSTIYYLFMHRSEEVDDEFIIRIQNHYVSKFLSGEEGLSTDESRESFGDIEFIANASEWAKNLAEETFDPAAIVDNFPELDKDLVKPEAGTQSFEDRAQARRSAASYRQRSMDLLRQEVQHIGLLGIITSGSGLVSREEVQDILEHADTSSMRLASKIGKVTNLRVPRPGVDYFGPELGKGDRINLAKRESRARRVVAASSEVNDYVEALAETREQTVDKNEEFQEVPDVPESLFGLRRRPKDVLPRRDINSIREVVIRHNPAIQDCYRQELKLNPDLKGKLKVRFTIDINGYVSHAEIVRSTLNNATMEGCIIRRIRRWNDFGRVVADQGELTISHTYVFGY